MRGREAPPHAQPSEYKAASMSAHSPTTTVTIRFSAVTPESGKPCFSQNDAVTVARNAPANAKV